MKKPIRRFPVAVLGANHWGKNLIRICRDLRYPLFVVDPDPAVRSRIRRQFPEAVLFADPKAVWRNPDITAVFLATPSSTHFSLAKLALTHGKHTFVEKPMTQSVKEMVALLKLQKQGNRILMVDHTYLYSPALKSAKQCITNGMIGTVTHIDSIRIGPGIIRNDGSVLWDLAPHDISIGMYLTDASPTRAALLSSYPIKTRAKTATIRLRFDTVSMQSYLSWISPVKIRELVIYGTKGSLALSWDGPRETLSVFPNHASDGNPFLHARAIKTKHREPVEEAVRHFFSCIEDRATPLTDGTHALQVIRTIAALERATGKSYP